jgi:hypothetical protein
MEALDLSGLKLACCTECAHLDRRGDEIRAPNNPCSDLMHSATSSPQLSSVLIFSALPGKAAPFEVIMMLSSTR